MKKLTEKNQCVIYNRTSSDEQRQEGYSIEYQESSNRTYAVGKGFIINKVYNCSESAKEPGRKVFNEMLDYVKKNKNIKHIIFKKSDRSCRNEVDAANIIHLALKTDLNFHFVEDGMILNRDSKPFEFTIFNMNCSMASMYPRNLSIDVKNGYKQKAAEGHYPQKAVYGYKGEKVGKKSYLKIDETKAPLIKRAFNLYATGLYSYKTLAKKLREEGFVKSPTQPVLKSTVEHILNNPIYMGDFIFKGEYFENAKHEAIVSRELFRQVQNIINKNNKPKQYKHNFLFTGLIKCEHCGCAYVGEHKIKKFKNGTQKEYTYYRCTGNKGGKCAETKKYTNENKIEAEFIDILKRLVIPDEYCTKVREAVRFELEDAHACNMERIAQIEKEIKTLRERLKKLLIMRTQDEIDALTYKDQRQEWQERLQELTEIHEELSKNSDDILNTSEIMLELTQNLAEWYIGQNTDKKREIINIVCSNLSCDEQNTHYELRSVFKCVLDFNENKNGRTDRI